MVHEVKTQNQGKYKIFHPLRKGAKKKKRKPGRERELPQLSKEHFQKNLQLTLNIMVKD